MHQGPDCRNVAAAAPGPDLVLSPAGRESRGLGALRRLQGLPCPAGRSLAESGLIRTREGVMRGRRTDGRILIYSHDTFGLGHLRRCRAIAHALVDRFKQLSVL